MNGKSILMCTYASQLSGDFFHSDIFIPSDEDDFSGKQVSSLNNTKASKCG